jgi:hypothetical protein
MILGNVKEDIVVAALQSPLAATNFGQLCEWYRWQSASFGG